MDDKLKAIMSDTIEKVNETIFDAAELFSDDVNIRVNFYKAIAGALYMAAVNETDRLRKCLANED